MADFCKQCSIDTFTKDFGDHAKLCGEGQYFVDVICEGCGRTVVDQDGECCLYTCIENHGIDLEYKSWLK